MIKFFLHEILQELKISQSKFAKQAAIRPNTINDICNNRTKRIELTTLTQILKVLNEIDDRPFRIGDVMEYIEEELQKLK
ncbi:helix-turn-helix transcriptional regulator [Sporosarcina sp. P26b]|uniref:helix-turn-helix domain-containing protein n=1 Tax=Sporosarcina sp. P26b TaxID=2048253 RepID=UPI001304340E|nr:helix-turn-helix transcriptional regulator [Sporosarcina sp. P26b]